MSAILAEWDCYARHTSRQLENEGRLSHGFTDYYYPLTRQEESDGRRARACWALATDIPTLRALLRGDAVPRHRLNHQPLDLLNRWPR